MTAKTKKEKISKEDIATATVKAEALAKDLTGKSLDTLVSKTVEQFKPEAKEILEEHAKDLQPMVNPWDRSVKDYPKSDVLNKDLKRSAWNTLTTPFVMVDGVVYGSVGTFTAKGNPKTGQLPPWNFRDHELELPRESGVENDVEFTIFNVKLGKEQTLVLLDKDSSLIYASGIRNKTYAEGDIRRGYDHREKNIVKLVNSSSFNDSFEKALVSLTNIDSSENHFVGDVGVYRNQGMHLGKYYGEFTSAPRLDYQSFNQMISEDLSSYRIKIEKFNLANTVLIDCKFDFKEKSSGSIIDSHLTNVTLEGGAYYNSHVIRTATLRNVELIGKHVTVENTSARDTKIAVEDNIRLGAYSLFNKNFVGKGYYAPTKFNNLELDTPEYTPYVLQVTDAYNVAIGYGNQYVNFKIAADFETVKQAVKESIELWSGQGMADGINTSLNSQINNSVFRYMVDSVWSRLKIINLVEGAKRLTESVQPPSSRRY